MSFFIFYLFKLIAALTDPVKFLIILPLIIMWTKKGWSRWKMIAVATLIGGLASELLLTWLQGTRTFGQGLDVHLIASLIISCLSIWLAERFFVKKEEGTD